MSQFDLPTVFCEIDLLGQREGDRANVSSTRESKYKPQGLVCSRPSPHHPPTLFWGTHMSQSLQSQPPNWIELTFAS